MRDYKKPELEYVEFEAENVTDVSMGNGTGTDIVGPPGMD